MAQNLQTAAFLVSVHLKQHSAFTTFTGTSCESEQHSSVAIFSFGRSGSEDFWPNEVSGLLEAKHNCDSQFYIHDISSALLCSPENDPCGPNINFAHKIF